MSQKLLRVSTVILINIFFAAIGIAETWQPIEQATAPRIAAAATWHGDVTLIGGLPQSIMSSVVGNRLVVIGSRTNTSRRFTGGIYEFSSNSWQALPEREIPGFGEYNFNVAYVAEGPQFFLWGGCSSQYCRTLSNSGWRVDATTNTWTALPTLNAPSARQSHRLIMVENKMLVWFGYQYQEKQVSSDIAIYDPKNDTWSAIDLTNGPAPRLGAAVWYANEKLYVVGGHDGSYRIFSDGFVYDFSTQHWSSLEIPSSFVPRYEPTVILMDGKTLLWGGIGSKETYLVDGATLDLAAENWSFIGKESPTPTERIRAKTVWTGERAVVMGGYICRNTGTGVNCSILTDGYAFSPTTNKWEVLPNIGFAPATANWNGEHLVVWGGMVGPATPTYAGALLKLP